LNGTFIGYIHLQGCGLATPGFDFLTVLSALAKLMSGINIFRTLGREPQRKRPTDAFFRSSYNGNFIFQRRRHYSLLANYFHSAGEMDKSGNLKLLLISSGDAILYHICL